MPHAPSAYLDLSHCPVPALFDGVEDVWNVLPRIAPWLAENLVPANHGTISGNVYTEGKVFIGEGARIMHGAVLLGPVYIGPGTYIGPGCYIRQNTIIGSRAIIGNSCELKNCILFDNTEVPHWNYVGDSVMGYKAHIGAGVILSNYRLDHGRIPISDADAPGGRIETGLEKFGAVVGDNVDIGANAVINPGSLIGPRSWIYPGAQFGGVLKPDRILKVRQQIQIVERKALG